MAKMLKVCVNQDGSGKQAHVQTQGARKKGGRPGVRQEWTGRRERMVASTSKKQTAYIERDMIDEHRPVDSS